MPNEFFSVHFSCLQVRPTARYRWAVRLRPVIARARMPRRGLPACVRVPPPHRGCTSPASTRQRRRSGTTCSTPRCHAAAGTCGIRCVVDSTEHRLLPGRAQHGRPSLHVPAHSLPQRPTVEPQWYQRFYIPAHGRFPEPHWDGPAIPGYNAQHDLHVEAFKKANPHERR